MKATITLLLILFTSIATFGQVPDISGQTTTETRFYNNKYGKYTKEMALQKVNDYVARLKNGGFVFNKIEEKSAFHFTINWQQQYDQPDNKMVVIIEYIIGDNDLTLKLKTAVYFKSKADFVVLDRNSKIEAVGQLYNNQVSLFIDGLFDYIGIKNNKPATSTTTAGSNTNTTNPYSGMSTEAAAYLASYNINPNGLKKYLGNQHKSWEDKGYSAEKITQSYADMFKEVYTKDKKAAFELIIHMPDSWLEADKLKSVFSLLTKEQQLYIQDEANRR